MMNASNKRAAVVGQPMAKFTNDNIELGNMTLLCHAAFDEQSVRKKFVCKVFLILMSQLCITLASLTFFEFNEEARNFVMTHTGLFWMALLVMLIIMLLMACFEELRREVPLNYIFLGIFTLAQSFLVDTIVSQYEVEQVFCAIAITAGLCLVLSLYALQTKYDFTSMGSIILISLVLLIVFALVTLIFPSKLMIMLYSSMGAFTFSIYLIYDIQMMMGGQHKYSLNPEEYIFASLNLYLDIINLFLYILSLITTGKN